MTITSFDDTFNEGFIFLLGVKIMRAPDEQSLPALIFQVVIGAFDSAILMSNTTIITRRLKAIMLGEISKASCEDGFLLLLL